MAFAATTLIALAVLALLAGRALALPANCSQSGSVVTCTFSYTGSEQTFTVPSGVSSVQVSAVGGAGAAGAGASGGTGGTATAPVAVSGGDVLKVEVGGAGSTSGAGGWNGGGTGHSAGGGGASDVRTLTSRLVVAGGGGGGGEFSNGSIAPALGGNGGAAGVAGSAGQDGENGESGGGGGGAGTLAQGGAAGPRGANNTPGENGHSGGSGQGGEGGSFSRGGGGGGGGYFGGGGGGGSSSSAVRSGAGGGGGGGSSYAPGGTTGLAASTSTPASVTISYHTAPAITSANHATFTTGQAGSFTVTTLGVPRPSLSESGALPAGVGFTDHGDGSASLSGTPAAGAGGTYPLTITASNGVSPDASQSFTLTVDQPPAITSPSSATFTPGSAGSFAISSTGFPTASLAESGSLPAGLSFTDNGDGTGSLSGTPAAGTGGSYPLTITASNGVSPDASQSFTLTVDQATLGVTKSGSGAGTISSAPAGIDCGASCSAAFDKGAAVTLTATPAAGSTFSGFSGGGCAGTAPCAVTMNADTAVDASFTANTPPPPSPPNTKISGAKINQGNNSAAFKFKSVGGGKAKAASGFQCALVKKKHAQPKFKSCTSPKKYKHLKPRSYTFDVRAFGTAGKDPTPAKRKFKIKP